MLDSSMGMVPIFVSGKMGMETVCEWKVGMERERVQVDLRVAQGIQEGCQLPSPQFFHLLFAHRSRLRSTDNLN